MSEKSNYHISGYHITTDPSFQHERLNIPQELISQYEELYLESRNKKNKKIIPRLTNMIFKYPQSPQLKNFLTVAYHLQGDHKKAIELNDLTITEHPDYLFSKLNLAFQYITNGEAYKVPELLGDAMELKALYPERDLFHLAEVTGFYKLAIYYYASIGNFELAENRLGVLKGIAPDHMDTIAAQSILDRFKLTNMHNWKDQEEDIVKVICSKPVPLSSQEAPPVFHHEQINNLYQYGPEIPVEQLKEILSLPRETIIADLEKVLSDAIGRFQYFIKKEQDESEEEPYFSLIHAIYLLTELRSENSLSAILDFLENDIEVLQFWLGDYLEFDLWIPVYLLGQSNLQLIKQFLLKPGVESKSKEPLTKALSQIVLHQPGRRDEIAMIFKDVLQYFSRADLKDNLIDSEFLGSAVGHVLDCGLKELLPVIKELYEKKYVSIEINGPFEEVGEMLEDPGDIGDKEPIENIFELYEGHLNEQEDSFEDDFLEDDFLDDYFSDDDDIQEPAVSVKIGRNEPCPCGSGKKFKKCCIDKLLL